MSEENRTDFLLYQTEDGQTRIRCRLQAETLWLTQAQLADLFQTTPQNITLHIKTIYAEREQDEAATCKQYLQVQNEGTRSVSRKLKHYRLDMVLAVGFRVRSHRGTQFRQWATAQLQEYLVKGFTLDDQRLKNPTGEADTAYFEELLARIRDIRTSEKVFYRKVLDIYSTSVDYDQGITASQDFFKAVQNRMHWAAHGSTAAELIAKRADADQPNMGLTSWSGDKPRKQDVKVAKNYLQDNEIEALNRIVVAYLEFAELQALNRKPMYMSDWIAKLDDFLKLADHQVLDHAGKVSHDHAVQKALEAYERFDKQRAELPTPVDAHFEQSVAKIKKIEKSARPTPKDNKDGR